MIIFLDTETGGLDPREFPLIEVAWSVGGGPIKTLVLPHYTDRCDPAALEINNYYERGLDKKENWADIDQIAELLHDLDGNTLCCANPAFDAGFLKEYFGSAPWKYRLLDIEAFASGALGWEGDPVTGLRSLADYLRSTGHDIPEPNHTAAGDVATLIACYRATREVQVLHAARAL